MGFSSLSGEQREEGALGTLITQIKQLFQSPPCSELVAEEQRGNMRISTYLASILFCFFLSLSLAIAHYAKTHSYLAMKLMWTLKVVALYRLTSFFLLHVPCNRADWRVDGPAVMHLALVSDGLAFFLTLSLTTLLQ